MVTITHVTLTAFFPETSVGDQRIRVTVSEIEYVRERQHYSVLGLKTGETLFVQEDWDTVIGRLEGRSI
jgi:hypothetical protein